MVWGGRKEVGRTYSGGTIRRPSAHPCTRTPNSRHTIGGRRPRRDRQRGSGLFVNRCQGSGEGGGGLTPGMEITAMFCPIRPLVILET